MFGQGVKKYAMKNGENETYKYYNLLKAFLRKFQVSKFNIQKLSCKCV